MRFASLVKQVCTWQITLYLGFWHLVNPQVNLVGEVVR